MQRPRQSASGVPEVVTNHCDGADRVDWQENELAERTSFDYTTVAGATKITDPAGDVTTAGAFINAGDTSIVCAMGRGGHGCGADAAGAWFGFLSPLGAGRAGAALAPDVGTAAGLFADVFSTALANGIDTFRRC